MCPISQMRIRGVGGVSKRAKMSRISANQRVSTTTIVDLSEMRRVADGGLQSKLAHVENRKWTARARFSGISDNGDFGKRMGMGIYNKERETDWIKMHKWAIDMGPGEFQRCWSVGEMNDDDVQKPSGDRAIPKNRRNNWAAERITQDYRIDTRPALTRGGGIFGQKAITWSEYKNAGNDTVWLWTIHQRIMGDKGRNGRYKKGEKAREREKRPMGDRLQN